MKMSLVLRKATHRKIHYNTILQFSLVEAKSTLSAIDSGATPIIHFDCTHATESVPQWWLKPDQIPLISHKKMIQFVTIGHDLKRSFVLFFIENTSVRLQNLTVISLWLIYLTV